MGAGDDCGIAEGLLLPAATSAVSGVEKALWSGVSLDQRLLRLLRRHGRRGQRCGYPALHYGVPREVATSRGVAPHRFWAAELSQSGEDSPLQGVPR